MTVKEEFLQKKHTYTHSLQRKLELEIKHEKNPRFVGTSPKGGKPKSHAFI